MEDKRGPAVLSCIQKLFEEDSRDFLAFVREPNWVKRSLDEASDAFKLHALVDSLNAYELAIALEYCKRLRSARQK